MAFGFPARTSGLIVDPAGVPQPGRRYLADFAAAYADAIAGTVEASDAALAAALGRQRNVRREPRERPALLFTLEPAHRTLAASAGLAFVPAFPDPVLLRKDEPPIVRPARPARPAGSAARGAGHSRMSAPVRICLFGPESTGKSTLCADLARRHGTLHVTEYVRGYLDATGSPGTAEDVPWIARGQRAAEIATAMQVESLLVCDTNLATILLWSEVLFGAAPAWLRDEALGQRFDLWLLTDIDVPFEPDPQRCFPDAADRQWLMRECRGLLARLGVTPVLLSGSHEARMRTASEAIDRVLALY